MRSFISIVTIDSPNQNILKLPSEKLTKQELPFVREIAEQLKEALYPYFPAAGLAAPQIGINKSIFIYSYDRDPNNLETIINPTYTPIGDKKVEGWECCLSVLACQKDWKAAKVGRYEKILVNYLTINWEQKEKILEGFAAKAFQHECDHLEGIVNIFRPDAEIKQFETKEGLTQFMQEIKKEDALHYKKS